MCGCLSYFLSILCLLYVCYPFLMCVTYVWFVVCFLAVSVYGVQYFPSYFLSYCLILCQPSICCLLHIYFMYDLLFLSYLLCIVYSPSIPVFTVYFLSYCLSIFTYTFDNFIYFSTKHVIGILFQILLTLHYSITHVGNLYLYITIYLLLLYEG